MDRPPEEAVKWVTIKEMCEGLVGVHSSLSVEILQEALTRHNKNAFMIRWKYENISYFQPSIYQHEPGTPHDQNNKASGYSKRIKLVLPCQDCLSSDNTSSMKIQSVNKALLVYADDLESWRRGAFEEAINSSTRK